MKSHQAIFRSSPLLKLDRYLKFDIAILNLFDNSVNLGLQYGLLCLVLLLSGTLTSLSNSTILLLKSSKTGYMTPAMTSVTVINIMFFSVLL